MSKLKSQYFSYAGIRRLVNRTLNTEAKIAANPNEEVKRSRIESGVVDLICQKLQVDCENYVIKFLLIFGWVIHTFYFLPMLF